MRERRQVDCFVDLEQRPVASVDLEGGVAGIHDLGGHVLVLVAERDRRHVALDPVALVVEHDHAVLDGDEIPVPQVPGGPVAFLAEAVDRVQLDEAGAPLAQQPHRHEAHLALELSLDLCDHRAFWGAPIAAMNSGARI